MFSYFCLYAIISKYCSVFATVDREDVMTDLNLLSTFVEVIKTKSFSAAAKNLKLQKSTVSRRVAQLEEELGINLLLRTTRQVSPTEKGKKLFEHIQKNIIELSSAKNIILNDVAEPQGLIRLTAPVDLGSLLFPQVLASFKLKYPNIKIQLQLEDDIVDLISENIDIALRVGKLTDSQLKVKKIGLGHFGLYTSKKFNIEFAKIKHPKDLPLDQLIVFTRPKGEFNWNLYNKAQRYKIKPKENFYVNHFQTIKEILKNHYGIGLLPSFLCQEETLSGELVPLLPEWTGEKIEVSLVYGAGKFIPFSVRLLLEHLQKELSIIKRISF